MKGPVRGWLCGARRRSSAERGPKEVPRLGRVPVRKTPSLAIGGSAHSRPITSRTGNTLSIRLWSRTTAPGSAGGISQPRCREARARRRPRAARTQSEASAGVVGAEGWAGGEAGRPGRGAGMGGLPPPNGVDGAKDRAARREWLRLGTSSTRCWCWRRPRRSDMPTSGPVSPRAATVPRARRSRAPCSTAGGSGSPTADSRGSAHRP
jgi:hypothetical protein